MKNNQLRSLFEKSYVLRDLLYDRYLDTFTLKRMATFLSMELIGEEWPDQNVNDEFSLAFVERLHSAAKNYGYTIYCGHEQYFQSNETRKKIYSEFRKLSFSISKDLSFKVDRLFCPYQWGNTIIVFDDLTIPFTLDLHGFSAFYAEPSINRFLDKCQRSKLPLARIVYGKGLSVLHDLTHEILHERALPSDNCEYFNAGHTTITLPEPDCQLWPQFSKSYK